MILRYFIDVSFIILLFQGNISSLLPIIDYYDELFSIIVLLLFVVKKKSIYRKKDLILFACIVAILVIGSISNYKSGIPIPLFWVFVDYFSIIKVFIVFISIKGLCNRNVARLIILDLTRLFVVYIFVAGFFYIYGLLFEQSWLFKQVRFGIPTYGFIHGYAGDGWFGYYSSIAYCFFTMYPRKGKALNCIKLLALLLCLSTLKGPAILFVVFVVFLSVFKNKYRIKMWHIFALVVIGAFFGYWYIERYLLNSSEARALLNTYGLKLALTLFPFGLGFGTYGSNVSKVIYSPIYYRIGFTNIYGLGGSGFKSYLTDTYWGMLLGELGIIGSAIIAFAYYSIFNSINRCCALNSASKWSILALFFSAMAGSIGSPYLTTSIGVMIFLTTALFIASNSKS